MFKIKNNFGIILLLIILILILLSVCVKADYTWVQRREQISPDGEWLAEWSGSWSNNEAQMTLKGDIMAMTDEQLLSLSTEEREAYVSIIAQYVSDNAKNIGSSQNSTYYGNYSQIVGYILEDIEVLENNLGDQLTSNEKANIATAKTGIDNTIEEEIPEGTTIDFETFLETATQSQLSEAFDREQYNNGQDWVDLTDEQLAQVSSKLDETVDETNKASEEYENNNKSEHTILDRKPIGLLPEQEGDGQITVDDTIDGAMDFVNRGDDIIVQDRLQETIGSLYNVLLVIAMVVAVVTGLIIAIKFMTSSVEGKAEVKKTLVPYVISCAVTFGAFGIWKLVVEILNNLE